MAAATPNPATGSAGTQTLGTRTAATQIVEGATVATQIQAMRDAAEPENQPVPVSVICIHKKKWTRKSSHFVKEDEARPPREQEEEPEVFTRSFSLSEMRDIRKDFSCHPGEDIITWL